MSSIFNTLNIGYSGLTAAQVGIDVTGHNVANAETEGYSRQRVVNATSTPMSLNPGERGNGVNVTEIIRIFDSFVFDRYSSTATTKEYSDFTRGTLETLSTYFPEIEDVGIKSDMHAYFDLWQSLADNPDNVSIKMALAQQTMTMTQGIQQTREQVRNLQDQLNTQLEAAINDVNRIGEDIAALNKAIDIAEAGGQNNANDLRDQRNHLEKALSQLIGSDVFGGGIVSRMPIDRNASESIGHYNINIGGFNFVDGPTFHPIVLENEQSPLGMYDLFYERQDAVRIPFASAVKDGKIGAILDLRGSIFDGNTGMLEDGVLQDVINRLDALAAGIIEATNNVYAQSVTQKTESNALNIDPNTALVDSGFNIKTGSFDIVVYDIDGNETVRRTINITPTTMMDDSNLVPPNGSSDSIVGQIRAIVDDNADNNSTNDLDNYINVNFMPNGVLSLSVKSAVDGYTFAVKDNLTDGSYSSGTNFAGGIGLNRFFDGDSAKNIELNVDKRLDPTRISAHSVNVAGNNEVALAMVQMQFEDIEFTAGNITDNNTVYGYFDTVATFVGTRTNSAILFNDNVTAQFNAVEKEFFSISKVSIDEEMTNLIRYQTAYGAAAKVITTVDQMMNTLLGLKP